MANQTTENFSVLTKADDFFQKLTSVDKISTMAQDEADISGLKNTLNEAGDAYRHMIVSAEMTRRLGPTAATAFGYAHEISELR